MLPAAEGVQTSFLHPNFGFSVAFASLFHHFWMRCACMGGHFRRSGHLLHTSSHQCVAGLRQRLASQLLHCLPPQPACVSCSTLFVGRHLPHHEAAANQEVGKGQVVWAQPTPAIWVQLGLCRWISLAQGPPRLCAVVRNGSG